MTRFPLPSAHMQLPRGARAASRRRGFASAMLGSSLLLSLALAACGTTSHASAKFGAGDVGVFMASPVFSSATAGPQSGTPSGTALRVLRARDGRQVWTTQFISTFESLVLGDGMLFGIAAPLQLNGGSVPSVPLMALRERDGSQQWQVTPASPEVPLGERGNTLYVVALKAIQPSGQVTDEALVALAAADGHPLWSVDLGGLIEGPGRGGADGSILATNGTLLFLAVAQISASGSLAHGKIIAVRTNDGGVQWTRPLPQALAEGVSRIVVGGAGARATIYVPGVSNPPVSSSPPEVPAVLALDASSGAIRWTRQFTSPRLDGSPPSLVPGDQGVYATLTLGPSGTSPAAGPTGELFELSAQTGSQIWQASLTGPVTSLVGDTSALYVSAETVGSAVKQGQPGSALSAYQASSGQQVWSVPVASPNAAVVAIENGSLIVTGGVTGSPGATVPGPGGGFVEALSAHDGTMQWRSVADAETQAVLVGAV